MRGPISVIIPAFNEETALASVLSDIRVALDEQCIEAELVVVDDGSTDGTAAIARAAGARVLRHRSNRGYGAALKAGITAARHDIIAMTDADGTYVSSDIPTLLRVLDGADMVVGARTGPTVHIPLARRPAKWLLNRLAEFVTGARIPDLNSGLRVFRRPMVMQYFPILPDQFSWTTTITMALHCDKYAVKYVPVNYLRRTGRSKIVPRDAGSFALLILRTAMLFRPLRVFAPVVIVSLTYGVIKMIIDLLIVGDRNISASALLGFLSALLVLLIGMLGDALATRLGRFSPAAVAGVGSRDVVDSDLENVPDRLT